MSISNTNVDLNFQYKLVEYNSKTILDFQFQKKYLQKIRKSDSAKQIQPIKIDKQKIEQIDQQEH
jgi:hypothetical protein